MASKRPQPPTHSSSESSSGFLRPSSKRQRSTYPGPLNGVKIHLIQAKLEGPAIANLFNLAESGGAQLCKDMREAEVLVTAVRMRRRLERHIDWKLAEEKAVVTPEWLKDSIAQGHVMPCGEYAALRDLHDQTVAHCPGFDSESETDSMTEVESEIDIPRQSQSRPNTRTGLLAPSPDSDNSPVFHSAAIPEDQDPPQSDPLLSTPNVGTSSSDARHAVLRLTGKSPKPSKLNYKARLACQRPSPLVCPNQQLVRELDIMRRGRELEGEARSALSYQRAIGVIKAYPYTITSAAEVKTLPFLGVKILAMIDEYLTTGQIAEAQTFATSQRHQTLSAFASVHGIGPTTARKLYALGFRTFAQLEQYYGGISGDSQAEEGVPEGSIAEMLRLREDLSVQISRTEVEEIAHVIATELEVVQPGCVHTIVGGYRRGKPTSNDVDIVFTHPEKVTHVLHVTSFHSHSAAALRPKGKHWDSLEKSLTVFRLPPTSSQFGKGLHRRVDIIFAPVEAYWTAVVGWTGSTMFERDLRIWTKEKKGMKFDSAGMTRLYDSKPVYPRSEEELFELCGLEWIDPSLRNADA